jgi:hypothetical protein
MSVWLGHLRETEVQVTVERLGCGAGRIICPECSGSGDWTRFLPDPDSLPEGKLACVECKGTGFVLVSV